MTMASSFPYPGHRTMEEVLADEEVGCMCEFVMTDFNSQPCDHCPILTSVVD